MNKEIRADDDDELILRCQRELPYVTTGFELLLQRYEKKTYQACKYYLKQTQDTQEACQDVWLKVFHGLPRFQRQASFKTWLHKIVTRVCATYYERQQRLRDRQESLSEDDEKAAPETATPTLPMLPEDSALAQAMAQLDGRDSEAIVLRHVLELSLEEMAHALALNLSAAKMRLYRAETRLRTFFKQTEKK